MFPLVNNSRRRKFMNHENHNTRNTGTHKFNILFTHDSGNNKMPPDGGVKRWNRSFTISKTNIFKMIWIVCVKTKTFFLNRRKPLSDQPLYYDDYYSVYSCFIVFPCFFHFLITIFIFKTMKTINNYHIVGIQFGPNVTHF